MEINLQYVGTAIFAAAVCHTFLVGRLASLAKRFPEGSKRENLFHLLGEVEAVFLFWSAVYFLVIVGAHNWHEAVEFIQTRNYTEPKFVLVIMTIASTKPVVDAADKLLRGVARILPIPRSSAFMFSALVIGPLLGSIITEPAAMTVTATIVGRQFLSRGSFSRLEMYLLLGTLFVNVSIGGVLTNFAAPPVLMVAHTWNWDSLYMLEHFGWKAVIAVAINAVCLLWFTRRKLAVLEILPDSDIHGAGEAAMKAPWWVVLIHLGFLAFTVATSHYPEVFFGGFVFFLAFVKITHEFQEPLNLRSPLLVGGFLAGLVTLGSVQSWWLEPILGGLGPVSLYLGAAGLTAITDNAALTYLGSQVSGLTDTMKYFLVAGAVVGGGLTVIANAPNPAGRSILNVWFVKDNGNEISPIGLLAGATLPTLIALMCFGFL